jgi:hypothetical protein
MTRSRITGNAANGLSRLFSFLLLASLALGAVTLPAQQRGLAGQWRGAYGSTSITMVIQPNGKYIQHAQSGTLMTRQSGKFRLLGPNRITFSAANSAPNTLPINHASPAAGGYSASQRTEMPLGATNTIVFTGPNRIIFTDERTRRSITMTRVH